MYLLILPLQFIYLSIYLSIYLLRHKLGQTPDHLREDKKKKVVENYVPTHWIAEQHDKEQVFTNFPFIFYSNLKVEDLFHQG